MSVSSEECLFSSICSASSSFYSHKEEDCHLYHQTMTLNFETSSSTVNNDVPSGDDSGADTSLQRAPNVELQEEIVAAFPQQIKDACLMCDGEELSKHGGYLDFPVCDCPQWTVHRWCLVELLKSKMQSQEEDDLQNMRAEVQCPRCHHHLVYEMNSCVRRQLPIYSIVQLTVLCSVLSGLWILVEIFSGNSAEMLHLFEMLFGLACVLLMVPSIYVWFLYWIQPSSVLFAHYFDVKFRFVFDNQAVTTENAPHFANCSKNSRLRFQLPVEDWKSID